MSFFENMTTDGLEESQDYLGGAHVFDTDIYDATIKIAYAMQSARGAKGVTAIFDINGQEYREDIYMTNAEGKNYYERDGKKNPMAGFTAVNELHQLVTGHEISNANIEEKVVRVYDSEQKRELPKAVPVLVDLIGKPVKLAIQRRTEDRTQKDASGNYVPTGQTIDRNQIFKVFHPETKKTVNEYKANVDPADFHDKWLEKNKGQTRVVAKGLQGNTGVPQASGANQAPQKSLFGN